MPITKQRTLDYLTLEWGTYIERFHRLSKAEQAERLKTIGFESFRDMLAHILAWWEEGMVPIMAIAEGREYERKKYDFDVFNAQAVAKYKGWGEREFIAQFEKTRQASEAGIQSLKEAAFENRRLRSWANGIFIHHAREHLVAVSRFMTVDLLENEWAEYLSDFENLEEGKKKEFLSKQGFDDFHDLVAHVIGWWEEGARIISGILNTPAFTWTDPAADEYNIELTKKYKHWLDEDLFKHYHNVRGALIDLVATLPDDAFLNSDIEGWLAADVVSHYDDHPVPR